MSAAETRDAYLEVIVPLPNGKQFKGRPVTYGDARKLIAMRDEFLTKGLSLMPYLDRFHEVTGTKSDASELAGLTLGDVLDVTDRFFYWRTPESAPTNGASAPAPSPA